MKARGADASSLPIFLACLVVAGAAFAAPAVAASGSTADDCVTLRRGISVWWASSEGGPIAIASPLGESTLSAQSPALLAVVDDVQRGCIARARPARWTLSDVLNHSKPRSALNSPGTQELRRQSATSASLDIQTYALAGQPGVPVAALIQAKKKGSPVVLRIFGLPFRTSERQARQAVLETLYSEVLSKPPEARYLWTIEGQGGGSQDALLRTIAEARNRAADTGPGSSKQRWLIPALVALAKRRSKDPESAAVRGTVGGRALAGAVVTFSRDPHMACTATTAADGVAACKLFDTHGHTHDHHEHAANAPTVATFSGRLRPELIVPMTLVLPTR